MFLRLHKGVWHVVYNIGRKKYSISTRTSQRRAAKRFMERFRPPDSNPISVQDYASEYVATLRITRSPGTADRTARALHAFCKYVTPKRSLWSLVVADIEAYKIHRLRTIRPTTVNIELRHLRAALRAAVRLGYLEAAPRVELLRIPERRAAYFTQEDLEELLGALSGWARKFVLFAYCTGLRRNEIVFLKWENVDMTRRCVHVRNTSEFTTKSRRERIVPLNATALQLLNEIPRSDSYVFRGRHGGRVDPGTITKMVRQAVRNRKLDPRLHLHSLRHTFCTVLLQAGASFQEVQRLAGHSSVSVTERYNQMVSDNLHDVVQRLEVGNGRKSRFHSAGVYHSLGLRRVRRG